ncbi:MAG: mandelate racemase/muconate lactonizing enzyme family protein [Bacteroidales bacterium]|nr:mandelate racemase/muconate lactonizing enzyme family protein [Bacteroidales bacterium]
MEKNEQNQLGRREFMQKAAVGGLSMSALFLNDNVAKDVEYVTQKVGRYSSPSELKITDMKIAWYSSTPIIRIETNQGIMGYGEVRDGGDPIYALQFKARLLGENPCNIEKIFSRFKHSVPHGRQAGGLCGIEIALWDIVSKAYGVPIYQMLGGKYRDKIELYADTPQQRTGEAMGQKMKLRMDHGYKWIKMDFGINMLRDVPGALVGTHRWNLNGFYNFKDAYAWTPHQLTRIQITPKGIDKLIEYVAGVRNTVGYDVQLLSDHFGSFDINTAIQLAKAAEPYRLGWMEDFIPWMYTDQWKKITDAVEVPTCTGEDIFGKHGFKDLIEKNAVDVVHPDMMSSGGIMETKKIGDYAEEYGIAMGMHCAGTPFSLLASVHCAAATRGFMALEHHGVDLEYWEDLVTGIKPIEVDGGVMVPDKPGLGVEPNEEVIKQHLNRNAEGKLWMSTDEWNTRITGMDRPWS